MPRPTHLIVLTQMPPQGPTGVQTHFNAIAQHARSRQLEVSIVEPQQYHRWIRKVPGAINRLLNRTDLELAVLVHRFFLRRMLRALLGRALAAATSRGESVVVYAQDPLSARAALDLRERGHAFRLVGVVHFNVSEAQEFFDKGIAPEHGRLWRSLMANERFVLPRLDRIIFVSRFMQGIVAHRVPEITAVPQEVISNFPLPLPKAATAASAIRGDLVAIGTLEPRKNQRFLLQVLAECNTLGRRYTLTLAGDGPDRPMLERDAREMGLAQQVRFLGHTPNAAALIPGHKALVHAARMESQGIVLLEGLRAGTPVFAAPVGGIPEVFEDGQQGHYFDLDSPRSAALKLIAVLDSRQAWERMSANAWETYASRFHADALAPRWMHALVGA